MDKRSSTATTHRCHAMDIIIIDERPSVVGNSSNMIPNKTWYAGGAQGSAERLHREKDRGWGGNLQNEICKSEKTDSQDFDFFDLSRNLGIPSFNHFSATRSVPPRGWLFESWFRKRDMFMCTYRGIRVSKSMKDDWKDYTHRRKQNTTLRYVTHFDPPVISISPNRLR